MICDEPPRRKDSEHVHFVQIIRIDDEQFPAKRRGTSDSVIQRQMAQSPITRKRIKKKNVAPEVVGVLLHTFLFISDVGPDRCDVISAQPVAQKICIVCMQEFWAIDLRSHVACRDLRRRIIKHDTYQTMNRTTKLVNNRGVTPSLQVARAQR